MSFKRDMIDEIDGTSRLLVEVPIPGSDRFTYLLSAALSAGTVPALVGVVLTVGSTEMLLWPGFAVTMGIVLVISLMAFRYCLVLAGRPDFAVGKDGLLLREGRIQNHYDWEDVQYCHWSHYEPGVLNIQVGAHVAWSGVPSPPSRLFRPIPEAYQAQVEEAIRTMGKWVEGETDWALAPAVSWGNDSGGLRADVIDEFDGTQLALVEIPCSRRKLVASFFPALVWFCWGMTMIGLQGLRSLIAGSAPSSLEAWPSPLPRRLCLGQVGPSSPFSRKEFPCHSSDFPHGHRHGTGALSDSFSGMK